MKLSSLIEKQFRFVLGWSIFFGAAVLIIFSIMWTLEARHSSEDFIASHVRDIVLAGVNSQNAASIDGEVNRIVTSWSSSQIFRVRADIFIDGKHWAHGGEQQSFGWLSVMDKHYETLPSGNKLYVEIETDLLNPILRLGFVLLVFISFFVLVFLTLKHFIKKTVRQAINPLETRVKNIKEISENLLDSSKLKLDAQETNISELLELDESLNHLIERILTLEKDLSEVYFEEGQIKAAEMLAHSLKGAVASFQLTMTSSQTLSSEDRESLSSVLRQIIAISENVLKARKLAKVTSNENKTVIHVGDAISRIISLKEKELKNSNSKISFRFIDHTVSTPLIYGSRADFEGSIGNVIANSIESITEEGTISVYLKDHGDKLTVEIKDTGCGVSPEILPRLSEEGFTYGKPNGNGLGLFHLKKTINSMNGILEINSEKNKGTCITLSIPLYLEKHEPTEIALFPGQTLIIVDDDPLVHDVWDIKFRAIKTEVSVVHILTPPKFHEWMIENKTTSLGARQYLFDYEFTGFEETGLDLIEQYSLSFESLLISGIARSPKVVSRANKLKVQVIPKEELGNVGIKWEGAEEIKKQISSCI